MFNTSQVGILFGGRSAEHEVSIQSAQNIFNSLDTGRFTPHLILIDPDGQWFLLESKNGTKYFFEDILGKKEVEKKSVALVANGKSHQLICLQSKQVIVKLDVLFPVLHGPYGEDGSVQGMAKLADLPCVGAGILSSAISMDKDIMKRLLKGTGLKNAQSKTIYARSPEYNLPDLEQQHGWPMYVKPANMGSSVGVSRAENPSELSKAVKLAFQFDHKVIIEQAIQGREVEVAILGNDFPSASEVGEIVPVDGFYSYDSKYIDGDSAELVVPARLTQDQKLKLQETAIQVFELMECSGLARVDMFLTQDDQIYVNEINTLPGFTNISMYPKLWQASGLSQTELVTKLIELAIEKATQLSQLKTIRL